MKKEAFSTSTNSLIYNDLFFRSNLDSDGQIPLACNLAQSPDIIPIGNQPISDPQNAFATEDNYKKDFGKNLEIERQNYIYLRARNLSNGTQTGQMALYYCPCTLINWPSLWKNNRLKTETGDDKIVVNATANNTIAVTEQPFVWVPPLLPAGSDHYGLIAQVKTTNHPNEIPYQDDMSIIDFAQYMYSNPAIGWRNVTDVAINKAPAWTHQINLTQLDPNSVSLYIALKMSGDLRGAIVAISCGSERATPPIFITPTKITELNQVIGISSKIDSGFNDSISLSFWYNGINVTESDSIAIKAYLAIDGHHELYPPFRTPEFYGLAGIDGIIPTKVIEVGSFSYRFKNM